ncbi:Tetratricopeptide repeat (TPR)-like superfamily protein [Abeliophyllum distichum]|uniref:Tetratricopeptide repeat (TPR)-like superfamily protein n=1 Tax=Abeliophyllum distichum TaxID=126358 RepID=A0ABD1UI77_9LAMI
MMLSMGVVGVEKRVLKTAEFRFQMDLVLRVEKNISLIYWTSSVESENGEESVEGSEIELRVFDSFNRNRNQREVSGSIEGDEDELRHPLVKEVCRLIDFRAAWTPKLEGELRHFLRSLKPRQVCAVLRAQSDERVALKFFYWADRQWRYKHDPIVYYAMLQVLSKTKLCQGAKRVLHLMVRRKIECRPEDFGCVMVSFSRAGHVAKAMQTLTLMQKAGVELDLSICNTAIYVLVKDHKLEKALRFLERMQVVGIKPDVITYNCLIKGYCDVHQLENAMELIAEMPFKGCSPDKVSYYTVMGFLCKEKRIDEVRGIDGEDAEG